MSKRLQVLVDEKEYKEFGRRAKIEGVSVGEWVRQSLRQSLRNRSGKKPEEKMNEIRGIAEKGDLPSSNIEKMNKEISESYLK
jgi:hypothetical protein